MSGEELGRLAVKWVRDPDPARSTEFQVLAEGCALDPAWLAAELREIAARLEGHGWAFVRQVDAAPDAPISSPALLEDTGAEDAEAQWYPPGHPKGFWPS